MPDSQFLSGLKEKINTDRESGNGILFMCFDAAPLITNRSLKARSNTLFTPTILIVFLILEHRLYSRDLLLRFTDRLNLLSTVGSLSLSTSMQAFVLQNVLACRSVSPFKTAETLKTPLLGSFQWGPCPKHSTPV